MIGRVSKFGKDRKGRTRFILEFPKDIAPVLYSGMKVKYEFPGVIEEEKQ